MTKILYDDVEFDDDFAIVDGNPFTGIIYSLYADGSKETEFNYSEGLPSGLQLSWHPNGQLERRSMAVRGNGSSISEYWYPNGQKKMIRVNDENNNLKEITEWDELGNLIKHEIR